MEFEGKPYCEAVYKYLEDNTYNEWETFGSKEAMVKAAYVRNGCVNDAFWSIDSSGDVLESIIEKYTYMLMGVLDVEGYSMDDVSIVVQPSSYGNTAVVVIDEEEGTVIVQFDSKAWSIGIDEEDSIDELEQVFVSLAGTMGTRPVKFFVSGYWKSTGDPFLGALMASYEAGDADDPAILVYGVDGSKLYEWRKLGEDTEEPFVVTEYGRC